MKLFSLFLVVVAFAFFPGCAPGDAGHYTPSQQAAQSSFYDPTGRVSNSHY